MDSSAFLPQVVTAAKMKPMKAPMKRPIARVIIGSSFLDLWPGPKSTSVLWANYPKEVNVMIQILSERIWGKEPSVSTRVS